MKPKIQFPRKLKYNKKETPNKIFFLIQKYCSPPEYDHVLTSLSPSVLTVAGPPLAAPTQRNMQVISLYHGDQIRYYYIWQSGQVSSTARNDKLHKITRRDRGVCQDVLVDSFADVGQLTNNQQVTRHPKSYLTNYI